MVSVSRIAGPPHRGQVVSFQVGCRPSGDTPPAGDSGTPLYPIEEFVKWDLRVARVIAAEPHPRADRLLKSTNLGDHAILEELILRLHARATSN